MFCPYCGKQLNDAAEICLGCGRSVTHVQANGKADSNSVGWWWLGFFLPMVGFILWCVWTGNFPLKAKRVGWGALIGVITSVALSVLSYVALIVLMSLGIAYL